MLILITLTKKQSHSFPESQSRPHRHLWWGILNWCDSQLWTFLNLMIWILIFLQIEKSVCWSIVYPVQTYLELTISIFWAQIKLSGMFQVCLMSLSSLSLLCLVIEHTNTHSLQIEQDKVFWAPSVLHTKQTQPFWAIGLNLK